MMVEQWLPGGGSLKIGRTRTGTLKTRDDNLLER
jgi:hypothetical protein